MYHSFVLYCRGLVRRPALQAKSRAGHAALLCSIHAVLLCILLASSSICSRCIQPLCSFSLRTGGVYCALPTRVYVQPLFTQRLTSYIKYVSNQNGNVLKFEGHSGKSIFSTMHIFSIFGYSIDHVVLLPALPRFCRN